MLYKAKTLAGYKLEALSGEIGKVKDFYFNDQDWMIRYLVADTGSWLTGRQVLISPHALGAVSEEKQNIAVKLTKEQIEDSPSLDSDRPVSQQFERAYYGYYGWPSPYMWGPSPGIGNPYMGSDLSKWREPAKGERHWDPHLRSTRDVSGHHVQASDGEIGHVDDFIIDDDSWTIRYLIVDTRNRWPGKKVLVSPQWIERVSWSELKVFVNLPREAIRQSPEYTEKPQLTRDYEVGLHRHYNRQGYWVADSAAKSTPAEVG